LPSSLVFLVVLFSVAARASAARSRAALVIALAGVGIATGTAADALRRFTAGGWLITFYLGVGFGLSVLMTWNLGRLALVRRQRAATERAEAARLAVLEERARIAREMHDIVAHSLAVIVRQAEGGAFVAGQDPRAAGRVLQTIAGTSRSALADMRGLLGVLRDPASDRVASRAGSLSPIRSPRRNPGWPICRAWSLASATAASTPSSPGPARRSLSAMPPSSPSTGSRRRG
jgi:signal transduction histidine kinase